jgi:four helix bundle protein
MKQQKPVLSNRLFNFSVDIIKYSRTLSNNIESRIIKYQLIKSATSAGANYMEAQAGSSRADFHNKVKISLKEMVETTYCLKIIKEAVIQKTIDEKILAMIQESIELSKILGAISSKTRK